MKKFKAVTISAILFGTLLTVSSFQYYNFNSTILPGQGSGGEGKMISFPTSDGKEANAFLLTAKVPSTNYLFIFHDWWGLDDNTKKQTLKYYGDLKGVTVMAIDLYDGVTPENEEKAAEMMRTVDEDRIRNIIKGAIKYAGNGAEISTLGWSVGGTWALRASILMEDKADGCVMYYAMPEKNVEKLKMLQTDVLAFFAKNDNWVTEKTVGQFRQNMKAAGKTLEVTTLAADQGFANPNDKRYDRLVATKAYNSSIVYLKGKIEN